MRIAISQSMLFPWVGFLEQVRLANIFIHYDDVQFSKGSLVNRVQIKTEWGIRWLTVPLRNMRLGQTIDTVLFAPSEQWRARHLEFLRQSFARAPFGRDALDLAASVYAGEYAHIGALARASLLALVEYFGLSTGTRFLDVRDVGVTGSNSSRVLEVVRELGCTDYITGHGGARYLDHAAFESRGVKVSYMKYRRVPYPQLFGPFTPYVSALDLVANVGRDGAQFICSDTVDWREFVAHPKGASNPPVSAEGGVPGPRHGV